MLLNCLRIGTLREIGLWVEYWAELASERRTGVAKK